MAKKNIVSNSKLGAFVKNEGNATASISGIVTKEKKDCFQVKSFRIANEEIELLQRMTKSLNDQTISKISDTKIIRALIHIGSKIEKEKLLKTLGDIL